MDLPAWFCFYLFAMIRTCTYLSFSNCKPQ